MENTTAQEVFDCFESSFGDKKVIPFELELIWLKRAISRYSVEVEPLAFSEESLEFDSPLDVHIMWLIKADRPYHKYFVLYNNNKKI